MNFTDDPEIALGSDPAPSAPPLPVPVAPPKASSTLPTAMATPLLATPVTPAPAAATAERPNEKIETTTNADGSLSVKLTTTTPRPNGYREIKIEYFHVPQGAANAVGLALDAGDPPASLYMTKMEQQVLPPGTEEVIGRPPSRPPAASQPAAAAPPQNAPAQDDNLGRLKSGLCCAVKGISLAWAICCGVSCVVFIVVIVLGVYFGSKVSSSVRPAPSPSPPSIPAHDWPFPSPSSPTVPWPVPSQHLPSIPAHDWPFPSASWPSSNAHDWPFPSPSWPSSNAHVTNPPWFRKSTGVVDEDGGALKNRESEREDVIPSHKMVRERVEKKE